MRHSCCQLTAGLLLMMPAFAGEPAPAPPAANPLSFVLSGQEYRFDTGVLRGTLRPEGKSLGLRPVLEGAAGGLRQLGRIPVAGPYGLFSLYRLLTADARFGTAAWDWASGATLLGSGAVAVQWTADQDHPLDMTAAYRWIAPNVLEVRVTVKPRKDLRIFELFLASYFDGFPASFAYAQQNPQAGGAGAAPAAGDEKAGFMEARKEAGYWLAFPRDNEAARIIADGRWQRPPNPVDWKVMPRLAAPLALRRDAKSGLAAVLMAPAEDCFAISMPYGEESHRSVYLSLFGRDIKSGESASARARLVIGRGITDQQALDLYHAFAQEPRLEH